MSRKQITESAIRSLARHPYLWALGICLLINPFFFGAVENIPNNALWLENFLVVVAVIVYGVYRHRSDLLTKKRTVIFIVLLTFADFIGVSLYSRSQNTALWHFAGGCGIIFILYYFSDLKKYRTQINSLLIMGLGFCLKLYYVLITSVYTRQHDVYFFDGDSGHAGYIEYLLFNHRLPDFDVRERWQFCHPPLHHAISAVWIYLNENILRVGHDPARESLQTLTLFYSMCIIISAYKIFRYFKLEGKALYIPLMIVSFHPAFILFSGSINNDVLSVAFMMGATVSAFEWYREQKIKSMIKTALCIGLGMMTKISAAVVAVPIGLLFLIVFISHIRSDSKKLIGQFTVFALICVPLGLWFGVRNYINWDMSLTYVQPMGKTELQYIGDQDFFNRVTDFSPKQLKSVYLQWAYMDNEGNVQGYNEYNPLISAMKTAVFGEFFNESSIDKATQYKITTDILFWSNILLALEAFISMLMICFRKSSIDRTEKAFLISFYLALMLSFYKMAHDYPFTCTMNFRYITPTVILGTIFLGLYLKNTDRNYLPNKVNLIFLKASAFVFASASSLVYLLLC